VGPIKRGNEKSFSFFWTSAIMVSAHTLFRYSITLNLQYLEFSAEITEHDASLRFVFNPYHHSFLGKLGSYREKALSASTFWAILIATALFNRTTPFISILLMSSRGQDLHVPEEIAKLLINHALGPLWVSNAYGSGFLH
jgi:hypothetical protein